MASSSPSTSTRPTKPSRSPTSGGAGTSRSPTGYGFVTTPPRVFLYAPVARLVKPLKQRRAQEQQPDPTLEERLSVVRDYVEYGNSLRYLCRTGWYRLLHVFEPPPRIKVDGQDALVLSLAEQMLLGDEERQLERTVSSLLKLAEYLKQRGTTLLRADSRVGVDLPRGVPCR